MTMEELERCIDVYGKDIYTFCLWLTKNQEYADDLYQDTFLTAIEVIDRIDSEENMKSYLLSISVRLWKNRKRKWAWRNRIAPTVEMTEDFHVDLAYEEKDRVLDEEKSSVLKSAIAKLPERCIEVYGKDIYTFCLWLAKSGEHADDLYQDTFLKAIEVIYRLDSEENMKSYLLSISVRLWKNKKENGLGEIGLHRLLK